MVEGTLYRLSAFAEQPGGGNPAGVWIGEVLPEPGEMLRIAAEVGYSETAFVAPATGLARDIRYYSPEAEVSFCGHATIASGVVLGRLEGEATYTLTTTVGVVPVEVRRRGEQFEAAFRSVATRHKAVPESVLDQVLETLDWQRSELDSSIPPVIAYAGAWHLVLAVERPERLSDLHYDFETLKSLMLSHDITTLQLIWRESRDVFHSRNPFPVGGVVEDPATGAAAAALGGYLRDAQLIDVPMQLRIRQGMAMGRPSRITVDISVEGGIRVAGLAVDLQ